jgi:glucose-6-phosphate 1-epimerase
VANLTHNFLQNALGAQLLQAGPLLYLSPQSGTGVPARGGVPVLFPQFADTGPLPKHGWARNLPWDCVAQTATSSHFRLVAAPGAHATWQHHCTLDLHTTVGPGSLHQTLSVHNTGSQAFGWTGGLHPYWALDDLRGCKVSGLGGLAVQDRYDASLTQQPPGDMAWTEAQGQQPLERLYGNCPPLVLHTGAGRVALAATGFTQWMVWSPGATGAAALPDLPPEDWRRFVCIEPVCVSQPVAMAPGATFVGTLTATLL